MRFGNDFYTAAEAMKNHLPFQQYLGELAKVLDAVRESNDLGEGQKLHWGQGKAQILKEILDNSYSADEVVLRLATNKKEGSGPSPATIT